ncbi:alcohol dehydrogenase GroES-like domain-containing protein [Astrocystis sublimbata]|nr:alcohol dehydrogenase GroES-like domain-containing protein [Astrocystis sublimbata]
MAVSNTMECLVQSPDGKGVPVVTTDRPIPRCELPYDVLIKVTAVALNPTDYKSPQTNPTPGAIIGVDFAGTVVSTHTDVEGFSPGDRVCGGVHGSNPGNPNNGAFAQYLISDSRLLVRLPESWSYCDAAALGGVSWGTVALAMEDSLKLTGLPSKPAAVRADGTRIPVLVYGGATATGTMACQLLEKSGYEPIATCSPASSAMVQSYGAAQTLPYSSSNCGETIFNDTKGSLRHAIDCITTPESISCCFKALARAGPRYASLEYAPEEYRTRKAVKVDLPITYVLYGREVKLKGAYHREANPANVELGTRWRNEVEALLREDQLRAHPVREVPGKWQGIMKGLELLRSGHVRGQKLVVRL